MRLLIAAASLAALIGAAVAAHSRDPHGPPGALHADRPSGPARIASQAVEIALRVEGGRLIVPVRSADGTVMDFAVSTGSTVTVLSESAARRLGEEPELTVGGLPVPLEGVVTVPDVELGAEEVRFAGQIGANMLNAYDVLVDAPGGRLVLKPVGRSVEWPGTGLSEAVRLQVFHGMILSFEVEVNGRRYPAMLDLGSRTLLANERVVEEAGIEGGRAAAVGLGGAVWKDVSLVASDHPVIGRFSPNGDGFVIVGASIAADCAIAISWVHRELRTCVR